MRTLLFILCLCLGGCAQSETTPAKTMTDVADLAVYFFGLAAVIWAFRANGRRD